MIVPWPVSLPQFINESGFSYQIGDNKIESQNDIGGVKRRRTTTRPIDRLTGSMDILNADLVTFFTFYNTTLNGGITPFIFNDPFTGLPQTYRFVGEPSITPKGGLHFVISFTWEKVP